MNTMFESTSLGGLAVKNRLVRSATLETGGAQDGKITPLLGDIYRELAAGGVGLIITGMMGVAPGACIHSGMAKIYDESFPERFQKIADGVHALDGKLVVQLGHCGAKSRELDGAAYAHAPSDIDAYGLSAKALTVEELEALVKAYGTAALRCRQAGADGVQIHAAHGYLLCQFLSPLFNHRTDAYGGAIENRARLLLQVYDEIRAQVGPNYPVLVKINYSDLAEGGISEEDVLWFCRELDRRGIDAIEVSAGIGIDKYSGPIRNKCTDEGFNASYARRLAQDVGCAIISVGGYRSPEKIEEVLSHGDVAATAFCRALIREPDLPRRWEKDERTPAACISCGKCFGTPQHGCIFNMAG